MSDKKRIARLEHVLETLIAWLTGPDIPSEEDIKALVVMLRRSSEHTRP